MSRNQQKIEIVLCQGEGKTDFDNISEYWKNVMIDIMKKNGIGKEEVDCYRRRNTVFSQETKNRKI